MYRLAAALLFLTTAASAQPVPEWRQAREYEVRLTSFDIEPREMRFRAGEPLRLRLVNVSGQTHSFDAGRFFADSRVRRRGADAVRGGKIVIPPGEERTVLLVPRAGRYDARSSNFLYRVLGMSSRIIVE